MGFIFFLAKHLARVPKICYTNVNKVNVSCIILYGRRDAYMTKDESFKALKVIDTYYCDY